MAIARTGVFVDDYLEYSSTLPAELQRLLNTIRELDERSQAMINQTRQQTKYCLSLASQGGLFSWKNDDEEAMFEKLRKETEGNQDNVLSLCTEKILLARQAHDLIDSHVKRLDEDLNNFAEDLKHEGKISPDEPAVLPPLPLIPKTEKRRSFYGASQSKRLDFRDRDWERERDRDFELMPPPGNIKKDFTSPVELDQPIDPNEPTYCVCHQVSFGDMIACDNENCQGGEWFHYACVGLTPETRFKGKWFSAHNLVEKQAPYVKGEPPPSLPLCARMIISLSSSSASHHHLIRFVDSKTPISDFLLETRAHFSKPSLASSCSRFCRNSLLVVKDGTFRQRRRKPFRPLTLAGLDFGGLQSVAEAAAVLTAIIVVHESGHFLAAYLQGIHVSKFAVGFGPVLAKFSSNSVEYSIRAFPLGGFVGFPDNDPDSDIPLDDKNLLKNRPILDRIIVISSGVVANAVFAYAIVVAQVVSVGLPVQEPFPGVAVPEVRPLSAASRDGLLPGDVILGINGVELSNPSPGLVSEVVDVIRKNAGREVVLKISRGGGGNAVEKTISVTPDENSDGSGKIGVQLSPNVKFTKVKPKDVPELLSFSGREFWSLTANVLDNLRQTATNFSQSAGKVSGPVAIIAVGAEVAKSNSDGLFQFAALLNINLAVINLLPLPALDGGSLALILIEAARGGRKLPLEVEQGIVSSGVMVIVILGVFLLVRDTLSLEFIRGML
ncbi:hypothetical protein M569_08060 [Genlisea aurea]|uniref:PDZ domain-containing protein n=1 Tax=Genlisea aurea TaxID=192259 RepID=S8CPD0_9LAMI|nr:hypothetical protein M569_08060 [Genlisea aurea]